MKSRVSGLLLTGLLVAAGCTMSVRVRTPDPVPYPTATRHLMAGIAEADLAPPPGYPMAGYSINSHISRGIWTIARPKATALYVLDESGTPFVFVTTDLFAISLGLKQRVIALIDSSPWTPFLGESEVLLCAIHSHHSLGVNLPDDAFSLASIGFGFDTAAFEFTAQRIAKAIIHAVKSAEPASLSIRFDTVRRVAKNRSVRSYLENPRSMRADYLLDQSPAARTQFLNDREAIEREPDVSDRELLSMVDPTLTTLSVWSAQDSLIGALTCYPVHPTATGDRTEVYSADIFQIAATAVADSLESAGHRRPVIAFFNSAEGDVAPDYQHHDRADAMRIGSVLKHAIGSALAHTQIAHDRIPAGIIAHRARTITLASRTFPFDSLEADCYDRLPSEFVHTSAKPMIGASVFAGATDGRTALNSWGISEGIQSKHWDPEQGRKKNAVSFLASSVLGQALPLPVQVLLPFLVQEKASPEVPISIHAIGNYYFVGVPGEFTTMLGRRIRRAIARPLHCDEQHVIIVGLSDSYTSYVTTPCEFNAQAYEGAYDYFGISLGQLFLREFSDLAANPPLLAGARSGRTQTYTAGSQTTYGPVHLARLQKWVPTEGLGNLLVSSTGEAITFSPIPSASSSNDTILIPSDQPISFSFRDSVRLLNSSFVGDYYPDIAINTVQMFGSIGVSSPMHLRPEMLLTVDQYQRPLSTWTVRVPDPGNFFAADKAYQFAIVSRATASLPGLDSYSAWFKFVRSH